MQTTTEYRAKYRTKILGKWYEPGRPIDNPEIPAAVLARLERVGRIDKRIRRLKDREATARNQPAQEPVRAQRPPETDEGETAGDEAFRIARAAHARAVRAGSRDTFKGFLQRMARENGIRADGTSKEIIVGLVAANAGPWGGGQTGEEGAEGDEGADGDDGDQEGENDRGEGPDREAGGSEGVGPEAGEEGSLNGSTVPAILTGDPTDEGGPEAEAEAGPEDLDEEDEDFDPEDEPDGSDD